MSDFVARAKAIVDKYAPGELGLLNHLVEQFKEVATEKVAKWERIGTIGVDAGICWIGDPCYVIHADPKPAAIGNDWHEFCDKIPSEDRINTVTCPRCKGNTITFEEWAGRLANLNSEETVDDLRKVYCGMCDGKKVIPGHIDHWQFNYDLGHEGLGVVVSTGWGDGTYGVYVRRGDEGRIAEVRVVFMDSDLEPEEDN